MEVIQVQAIQPLYFKEEHKKINQYMKNMNASDSLIPVVDYYELLSVDYQLGW